MIRASVRGGWRDAWLVIAGLVLVWPSSGAIAAVTKIEIVSRTPYANGRSFDGIGPYETLCGKVHFAVDPQLPANRQVIDLELAPRNAAGLVEFSADVELLVPVDRSKSNGTVLYDVNNRGNKLALGQFNTGADEFLLRKGFVVVWSGWIAETLPGGGRLRLQAPVALEEGRPLVGLVRAEVVVDAPAERANLGQWANQGSYEPTERGERDATLTWRLRESDERVVIPRTQWSFEKKWVEADGERGQLPQIELVVQGGLQPGYLYEVVYEAQGSIVQGVGLAGIRDLVSFLKHDVSSGNPLAISSGSAAGETAKSTVRDAIGFGVSQSGRCLRTFLYDGFNADERGRRVFDGLIPHVAGAGLGFFNHRFASPTRHNSQHDNHLFPADQFPFAYGEATDPRTQRTDSLLRRAMQTKTTPKVMHTQSSSEYWHRAGSLVHTDPTSARDAEIPPEVRIYAFGGTQHGAGSGRPDAAPGRGQLIANPADYRPLMRALLVAMQRWVREDVEPPPSVYPRIDRGTLVPWKQSDSGWLPLPGVRYPEVIQRPVHVDRGSDFLTLRRTSIEPPRLLGEYEVRIPGYNELNNERGVLNLPCVATPVATYASWNLRNRSAGAEGELLSLAGGYIPLAKTDEARRRAGDPRPSLESLYGTFDNYLARYNSAAETLRDAGYLLDEDLPRLAALARERKTLFESP